MDTLIGMFVRTGALHWQRHDHTEWDDDDGLRIIFWPIGRVTKRNAAKVIADGLQKNGVSWLTKANREWILNSDGLRAWLKSDGNPSTEVSAFLSRLEWIKGLVPVSPEIGHESERNSLFVRFDIIKEEYLVDKNTKIFLSHKGADKPMVQRFADALTLLGFAPWLDKDAMVAGSELHREIQQGFKDSCAAVFFITPQFKDEAYLRAEVNYAIAEKTSKGDRFSIITLVFDDGKGTKPVVPDLLHSYVWREPKSEIEALCEIIKATPVTVGPVAWRSGLGR